jgi:hypothetical protein
MPYTPGIEYPLTTKVTLTLPCAQRASLDLTDVPGPLGFYKAELMENKQIYLTHLSGKPVFEVDAETLRWRIQLALDQGSAIGSGFILDILLDMLPSLCPACGRQLPEDETCPCREDQIADLLRMAHPEPEYG